MLNKLLINNFKWCWRNYTLNVDRDKMQQLRADWFQALSSLDLELQEHYYKTMFITIIFNEDNKITAAYPIPNFLAF